MQSEILLDGGALGAYYPQVSATKYRYNIADHLGNVRATVERDLSSGAVVIGSYADYYAWGMTMPGRDYSSSPRFRLGYQGQEYESKVGMYGFSLRLYDQRLGRWFSTDPYGQHWSPYLAMGNNPVSFVDPDGGWGDYFNNITYYVDGFQVSASEFGMWQSGAIGGDRMSYTGVLSNSLIWGLKAVTFYAGRGWGSFIDYAYSTFSTAGMSGNGDVLEGQSKGKTVSGSKFFAGTKPNPDMLRQAERPHGSNRWVGGLAPDGPPIQRTMYNIINDVKITVNAMFLKDKYVENLNGYGWVERGTPEYQSKVLGGMATIAQVGEVAAARSVAKEVASEVPQMAGARTVKVGDGGSNVLPMSIVREIRKGENLSEVISSAVNRTLSTGAEHAVVRLGPNSVAPGARVMVSGGPNGITFAPDEISLLIGHTHPYETGASIADFLAMKILGQHRQYIFEGFNVNPLIIKR